MLSERLIADEGATATSEGGEPHGSGLSDYEMAVRAEERRRPPAFFVGFGDGAGNPDAILAGFTSPRFKDEARIGLCITGSLIAILMVVAGYLFVHAGVRYGIAPLLVAALIFFRGFRYLDRLICLPDRVRAASRDGTNLPKCCRRSLVPRRGGRRRFYDIPPKSRTESTQHMDVVQDMCHFIDSVVFW